MSAAIVKLVGGRIFKETAGNKQGQQDPYFESVPATRLGVKITKKKRKALPPGLTEDEARILTKVKRRAYRLDLALFNCCGIRFGWSSVIGLVPAVGDVFDLLLAFMVVRTCEEVKPPLPSSVKTKMHMNLAIDFVIGIVPFLGDIADAVYKCNTKNAVLLENELRKRGEKRLKASNQTVPAYDPSLPEEWDNASDEEQVMTAAHGPPPRYTSRKEPRRPNAVQPSRSTRNGGGGRAWFGGSTRQDPDVEAPPPQPPRPDNGSGY